MLRRLIDGISIAIVATAFLVVGYRTLFDDRTGGSSAIGKELAVSAEGMRMAEGGQWVGPRTAPVIVVIFSDYTCGFCNELHTTIDKLRTRYPQHVATVVKHFVNPSRLMGYRVPLAAECAADEGRFHEYHSAAFRYSSVLEYSNGWRIIGDSVGLTQRSEFRECVETFRYSERIAAQYEEARRAGVEATPTMFVNGIRLVGAVPLTELDSIIAGQFRDRG